MTLGVDLLDEARESIDETAVLIWSEVTASGGRDELK